MGRRAVPRDTDLPPIDEVMKKSVEDLTDVSYPTGVPKNPDGTVATEAEIEVDEAKTIGAISEESARKNKAQAHIAYRKRMGETKIKWNSKSYADVFCGVRTTYGTSGVIIFITREDPQPPVEYPSVGMSTLRGPQDLYQYVAAKCHKRNPEATYRIRFRENDQERGTSILYFPDTTVDELTTSAPEPVKAEPVQQQPPPWYPGYPPYPPPPGYASPPYPIYQQAQTAPPPATAPVPPPQVVTTSDPVANAEIQRLASMVHTSQVQLAETMGMLRQMQTQQPPPAPVPAPVVQETTASLPGFIPLSQDQRRHVVMPPGYMAVPGGIMPIPPLPAAAQPAAPVGVAAPPPAAVAAPPAPPTPTPADQLKGMVTSFSGMLNSFSEMNNIFRKMTPEAPEPVMAPEPPPPPEEPPVHTVMMGDGPNAVPVAVNRDSGNVNWPMTLVGVAPRLVEGAKGVVDGVLKVIEKNQQHEASMWRAHNQQPQQLQQPQVHQAQVVDPPVQPAPEQAAPDMSSMWRPATPS